MSGLAINGDEVHGFAVGGQAFLPESQAGMPNLIGQAINFKAIPESKKVYAFTWITKENTQKKDLNTSFASLGNGDGSEGYLNISFWDSINTIYSEVIMPPFTEGFDDSEKKTNPSYREKNTLFLGVYIADSGYTERLWPSGANQDMPVTVYVRYDDVKDYILPNGTPASSN